jgi:hypothetical protein
MRSCDQSALVHSSARSGNSTLTATWPALQVLALDSLHEAVSDDFSVESSLLSDSPVHVCLRRCS